MSRKASLFAELRRRNVLRAVVLYAGAVWLLAQVLTQLGPVFHAPEWVARGFLIAAAIGFPFWLAFAWFYEFTPGGLKRESEIAPEDSISHSTGRRLDKWIIAVLTVAVVLLLASTFVWHKGASPGVDADIPAKSIAVLPFASMSSDKEDALFADGLSVEIINSLTRVPDLHVAARTSSFAFRNSQDTAPKIAARLRVATVLEGSVRRAGDRLRITAQLIRASDGYDLWSASYDRSSNDIIAIQEDVARSIAMALKTTIDPKALAAMQRAGTHSVAAYDAYLRGLALWLGARNTGDYASLPDVIAAYREAIRIDPAFADAYAQLASIQELSVNPTEPHPRSALSYAQRMSALRRNLDSAIAHARDETDLKKYLAFRALVDLRPGEGLRLATAYSRERPNDPYGLDLTAWLAILAGNYPLAASTAQSIDQRVGPVGSGSTPMQYMLWARDVPRALQMAQHALTARPDSVDVVYQAHRVLLWAGRIRQAARLVPALEASDLGPMAKTLVRMRQACAEGRTSDAMKLYRVARPGDMWGRSLQWQELLLLGRTAEAERLLDPFDTPDKLYALSAFMNYPMFDASRYPRLAAALKAQGIHRMPPQPEPYACKPGTGKAAP